MILNDKIHGVLYNAKTNEIIAECDNVTIEKEKDKTENKQLIHCYNIRGFDKTEQFEFV
jgi:hypothetical protein